jgi:hypothetical protein
VQEEYKKWSDRCLSKFTAGNLDTVQKQNDYFARYYAQIVGILFKNPPDQAHCGEDGNEPAPVQKIPDLRPQDLQLYQKQLLTAFDDYIASLSIFEALLDKALLAAAKPAVALEYDFNSPVNQPTTSTAKLIVSKAFFQKRCPAANKNVNKKLLEQAPSSASGKSGTQPKTAKDTSCASFSSGGGCINQLTLIFNGGGNFYNSPPSSVPGAGAFRDAQVGAARFPLVRYVESGSVVDTLSC